MKMNSKNNNNNVNMIRLFMVHHYSMRFSSSSLLFHKYYFSFSFSLFCFSNKQTNKPVLLINNECLWVDRTKKTIMKTRLIYLLLNFFFVFVCLFGIQEKLNEEKTRID